MNSEMIERIQNK